jgi:Txe/YoeB family toxin of toxin-antitoxin system
MEVVFTHQAEKDFEKIKKNAVLLKKAVAYLDLLELNPFQNPPPYEKLVGFHRVYSRRLNIQHRLIYQVMDDDNTVKIIRMWTHNA